MLFRKLTWLSLNWSRVCAFVREVLDGVVERLRVRVGDAAPHLHEREEVFWLVVVLVERCAREGHDSERGAARRRVEDPLDHERNDGAARHRDLDRRADGQVVVVGEAVVDEGTVLSELAEDGLRAIRPIEGDRLAGVRRDRGDTLDFP